MRDRVPAIPIVVLTAVIGAQHASIAAAQDRSAVPRLSVHPIAEAEKQPVIDGRVEEAVWQGVDPFNAFIQQEPNEGQPATERTEIRFLLDRQSLYAVRGFSWCTTTAAIRRSSRRTRSWGARSW